MSTGGAINRAANNPLAPRENAPQAAPPQPTPQGQPSQGQASPGGKGAMQQGPYQAPFNGIGFNPQTAGGGLPPSMMQQGMQGMPQGIFQQLAQRPQQYNPYAAPRMPAAPTPMPTQVPAQQGIAALPQQQPSLLNWYGAAPGDRGH